MKQPKVAKIEKPSGKPTVPTMQVTGDAGKGRRLRSRAGLQPPPLPSAMGTEPESRVAAPHRPNCSYSPRQRPCLFCPLTVGSQPDLNRVQAFWQGS